MGVALTVDVTFRRVESRSALRKQGESEHHDFILPRDVVCLRRCHWVQDIADQMHVTNSVD